MPRRAGGVGGHHRLHAQAADEAPALREGLGMALDAFDAVERRPRHREEMVLHRLEVLGDDVQIRLRQQMMDVRDPTAQRVVDRDHRERDVAARRGGEGVLEARIRRRLHLRVCLLAGKVAVRAWLSLESDSSGVRHCRAVDMSLGAAKCIGCGHAPVADRRDPAGACGSPPWPVG